MIIGVVLGVVLIILDATHSKEDVNEYAKPEEVEEVVEAVEVAAPIEEEVAY